MVTILLTIAAMVVSAGIGAAMAHHRLAQAEPAPAAPNRPARSGPVFLFRGDDLIDATADAQLLIAPFTHLPDRAAMLQVLAPHFPDLADHLNAPIPMRRRILHHCDDEVWIDLDWPGSQMRLTVSGTLPRSDRPEHKELSLLRDVIRFTPQLIWRTDSNDVVTWANRAYLDFWDRLHPGGDAALAEKTLFPALCHQTTNLRRIAVPLPQPGADQWFDVVTVPQSADILHYASDANAAVRADLDRRNFVQTLGKTFAELSIGLAIFDKRRQLATFNPALLDMTRLEIDFLSARPTIDTVLDRMREIRILPEPKNYASWRDQFTAVETAAKNGTYSEVWNLPDGQAFRVTGRPHPDGAFALLFEDITADLSLTRRFRSDIETGQAVLDALPDAVAVFSKAGTLVMYNRPYRLLWGMQPDGGVEHRALGSELAVWQSRCLDTGTWADLEQFIHQPGPRKPWTDDALLADGRLVRCHAGPIAGGMTLVRFALAPVSAPSLRKLTQIDPAIRAVRR